MTQHPASLMSALRKRGTITCQQCGGTAEALVTAKFCSPACRFRHHYETKTKAKGAAK